MRRNQPSFYYELGESIGMKFFQTLIEHFELPHLFLSIIFVGMGLLFSYILGIVTTLECVSSGKRPGLQFGKKLDGPGETHRPPSPSGAFGLGG